MAQKIDDHSFWAGKGHKTVLPEGAKTMHMKSAEGAGELHRYEDSEQDIHRQQEEQVRKVEKHAHKEGYRS